MTCSIPSVCKCNIDLTLWYQDMQKLSDIKWPSVIGLEWLGPAHYSLTHCSLVTSYDNVPPLMAMFIRKIFRATNPVGLVTDQAHQSKTKSTSPVGLVDGNIH